jgi:hypothetical protein
VFEWLICSRPEVDSHRFMDTVEAAIKGRQVQRHKAFADWAKAVKTRPRPKDPLAPPKTKRALSEKESAAGLALVADIRKCVYP